MPNQMQKLVENLKKKKKILNFVLVPLVFLDDTRTIR